MSYGRILKPRIYACRAAHCALRGTAPDSIVSIQSNQVQTGSDITDLIALSPQATTAFDTNGETQDVLISFDLQQACDINFISVLNHNLLSAGSAIRCFHHTAAITSSNFGSATFISPTEQVGSISGSTPEDNGSHLFTFTSLYKRYFAVQLFYVSGSFTADAVIGSILVGTYWEAPYAPDLQVRRRLVHDGVKVNETRGGKRHASVGWLTGSEGAALPYGVPFRTDGLGTAEEHHAGRREYEMTFSRLADTLVEEANFSTGIIGDGTGVAKWRDIMSLTGAGALPCIFTPDSTSTTAGDYLFARVTPGDETQVAPLVWNVSATISEEF